MKRNGRISTPRLARYVAWVLALVLLAPGLLGILPSPVTAQERALYADLQSSLCLKVQKENPASGTNHAGGECCILCTAPGLPQPQALIDPFAAQPLPEAKIVLASENVLLRIGHAALAAPQVAPITGRGPPA